MPTKLSTYDISLQKRHTEEMSREPYTFVDSPASTCRWSGIEPASEVSIDTSRIFPLGHWRLKIYKTFKKIIIHRTQTKK